MYTGGIPNILYRLSGICNRGATGTEKVSIFISSIDLCYGHDQTIIRCLEDLVFMALPECFWIRQSLMYWGERPTDGFVHISQCFKSNSLIDWRTQCSCLHPNWWQHGTRNVYHVIRDQISLAHLFCNFWSNQVMNYRL